jgi:hypothetical protein
MKIKEIAISIITITLGVLWIWSQSKMLAFSESPFTFFITSIVGIILIIIAGAVMDQEFKD